jgi:signal-transduction protein with cAMP-binding, CBS, and nucleotidyltransferase domain
MLENKTEIELLRTILGFAGMKPEAFDLSLPHWKLKQYKKGEFYNEYKNVCKHLGFVINGVLGFIV